MASFPNASDLAKISNMYDCVGHESDVEWMLQFFGRQLKTVAKTGRYAHKIYIPAGAPSKAVMDAISAKGLKVEQLDRDGIREGWIGFKVSWFPKDGVVLTLFCPPSHFVPEWRTIEKLLDGRIQTKRKDSCDPCIILYPRGEKTMDTNLYYDNQQWSINEIARFALGNGNASNCGWTL